MESKAKAVGIVKGVTVFWTSWNEDIPEGAVGTVQAFTADNVNVKFPAGAWLIPLVQLITTQAWEYVWLACAYGCARGERKSNRQGGTSAPSILVCIQTMLQNKLASLNLF